MVAISNKYKVILVDDEPLILRSLKAAIPWNELNLEVVGEARNGEGALHLIQETSPHMIISDIRMPGIDGISLMKEVSLNNPKLIFIIISGYGEFEYAREALRQGAFDYLLKPIDHDELTEMLKRAIQRLDSQIENEELIHSVQVLSLMARERMFAELIEGNQRSQQHLKWMESNELEHDYFMVVIQLDQYLLLNGHWTTGEKRLWLFAIRNILEDWIRLNKGLTIFPFHSGEWIILLPSMLNDNKVSLGEDIIRQIKKYSKLTCFVGISHSTKGIDQLSSSYQSATRALYQRFYAEHKGAFVDSDSTHDITQMKEVKYPKHIEISILECIRNLDLARMLSLFDQMKFYIEENSLTKDIAERMIIEMTVVLYRQFEYGNLLVDGSLGGLIQRIHEMTTLHEMIHAVKEAFEKRMRENRESQSKEDIQAIVEKAQNYIVNNYHKDLGIEELSELVGLSASHFCMIFKQISGFTFLEYLTKCRLEKAKYILKNTNVKVYQIAPLVGYQDPKYFTQVFKKAIGKTPTEYREETG
ncbi:response regulator [Paenibacillus crassostreae]|uniref:Two-component system response regulator n=1 Tax=Paenibacillus crassostreae TaxID=1763538 RepID=A0A167EUF9_9BACL|nr:response regulator [Paenibacillus crassostreae]AOZ93456.1 two-component system response regulator [Paenibacillus crassostreae]OAB75889.1 two-component system response regulator [Paenibacillus crassostreae]